MVVFMWESPVILGIVLGSIIREGQNLLKVTDHGNYCIFKSLRTGLQRVNSKRSGNLVRERNI